MSYPVIQDSVTPRRRLWARTASLSRNVLSNWVVLGGSVAYSLYITPIVIGALQQELYGVWSFLNGLLAYTELLYLGVGSALVRGVATCAHQRDQRAINRLASVVVSLFAFIGAVWLVVFLGTTAQIPGIFAEPLSEGARRAAGLAWMFLGCQVFFAFLGSGFSGLLLGHERFDLVNLARLTVIAGRFAAVPLVVSGPDPLVRLAAVMTLGFAVETALFAALAYWVNPGLRIRIARPRRDELRQLYSFGIQAFVIVAAMKLISYTDLTVIGLVLGVNSVALYALPLQLMEYARLSVLGVVGVLLPRLTVQHSAGDLDALRSSYRVSAQLCTMLIVALTVHLVFLGAPFLTIWIGPAYGAGATPILLCLGSAAVIQVFSTQVAIPFFQAMYVMRPPAVALAAEGVLNLLLSIALARWLGLTGVALATLLAALFTTLLILPKDLCRRLSLPLGRLLIDTVLPSALLGGGLVANYMLVERLVPSSSYQQLAIKVLSTVPLTVTAMAILLRKATKGRPPGSRGVLP